MSSQPFDAEARAAARYGAYAGFVTDAAPIGVVYHGENPADEVARLLDLHATATTRFLDVGCGAGGTVRRMAGSVAEAWGVDQASDLLALARERTRALSNVHLVEANVVSDLLDALPDGHFDLASSERGPNVNDRLVRKLAADAVFVQELVGGFDGYPLKEIFGRRNYAPYDFAGSDALLARYAEIGLFPISVKQYFYERFFRDAAHLTAFLTEGAPLDNWRLPARPYDPTVDRPALELYSRYNMTPSGIRLLGHRWVLALRRTTVTYYPVDGLSR